MTIGARVPVALAQRFDAVIGEELPSAVVRQLIEMVAEKGREGPLHERPYRYGKVVKRVVLRLTQDEAERLAVAASERSTTSANWLRTLMRRRLGVAARQDSDMRPAIETLLTQVRAIGRNINQATKALNIMVADGRHQDAVSDLRRIVQIASELEGMGDRLREIVLGDYRYWLRGIE